MSSITDQEIRKATPPLADPDQAHLLGRLLIRLNQEVVTAVPDGQGGYNLVDPAGNPVNTGGGGPLTATTYANGQMTSYTVGGVTTTLTYDPGTGRLASTTTNGVTKTLTYNPDGTLASYQ
jgi:hypothetical protein